MDSARIPDTRIANPGRCGVMDGLPQTDRNQEGHDSARLAQPLWGVIPSASRTNPRKEWPAPGSTTVNPEPGSSRPALNGCPVRESRRRIVPRVP